MPIALDSVLTMPNVIAPIVGSSRLPRLDEPVVAPVLRLEEGRVAFLEECWPHRILGHT